MPKRLVYLLIVFLVLVTALNQVATNIIANDVHEWAARLVFGREDDSAKSGVLWLFYLIAFLGLAAIGYPIWKDYQDSLHNLTFETEEPTSTRTKQIRQQTLEELSRIWNSSTVTEDLYEQRAIQLDFRPCPEMLDDPITTKSIARGIGSISQTFEESRGLLLILGAPGAGKTHTLNELTAFLLDQAQKKSNILVPFRFNLSRWNDTSVKPDQPLEVWLIDQLTALYRVGNEVAEKWVKRGEISLLLDGLDEVRANKRNALIQCLNDFIKRRGTTFPVVVTCRSSDYETGPKLHLNHAVEIQPLTIHEVEAYLRRSAGDQSGILAALAHHPDIYETLKSPLMLGIAARTFEGRDQQYAESLYLDGKIANVLINEFVERVFREKGASSIERRGAIDALRKIAKFMQRHSLSTFNGGELWLKYLANPTATLIRWTLIITAVIAMTFASGFLMYRMPIQALVLSGIFIGILAFINVNIDSWSAYRFSVQGYWDRLIVVVVLFIPVQFISAILANMRGTIFNWNVQFVWMFVLAIAMSFVELSPSPRTSTYAGQQLKTHLASGITTISVLLLGTLIVNAFDKGIEAIEPHPRNIVVAVGSVVGGTLIVFSQAFRYGATLKILQHKKELPKPLFPTLRKLERIGLLRRQSESFEFPHATFQTYFANIDDEEAEDLSG